MLGEFFAARESEVDDELLEAPYLRLQTIEAKGLSEVTLATLGEILGLGSYDDLVVGFPSASLADNDDVGVYRLPLAYRDALADLEDVDTAARRWVATEELRLDDWRFEDAQRVLGDVSALARSARDDGRELWYWWSL